MDAIKRTLEQLRNLYQSMASSQKLTLVVVTVLVLGSFGYLMFSGGDAEYVPLGYGKRFTMQELQAAQQVLMDEELRDFRTRGQELLGPKAELDRYNAVLASHADLSSDWPRHMEQMIKDQSGPWTLSSQREGGQDVITGRLLQKWISALPEIETGSVKWARGTSRGWRDRNPRVTAVVSVQPRSGYQLRMKTVQSLRRMAAGVIRDLDPKSVTVIDLSDGTSYGGDDEESAYDDRLLTLIAQHTSRIKSKLASALDYISDVKIAVDVDFDTVRESLVRKQNVDSKSVPLVTKDDTRTDQFTRQPVQEEPGVTTNRPNSRASANGNTSTQRSSQTKAEAVSTPTLITWTEETIRNNIPKNVTVAIQIPDEYYVKYVDKQLAGDTAAANISAEDKKKRIDAVKKIVNEQVKSTVAMSIGGKAEDGRVEVSSYVRVERDAVLASLPVMDTVTGFVAEWGGAIGLAIFAIWALRMLSKSMPALPEPQEPKIVADSRKAEDEEPETVAMADQSRRDNLQDVVRDHPDATARIVSRWIRSAEA
ncbi:MAG: hypothetical protein O3A00_08870 [Planctomycetota bacterium]|nr:hypothetical protein [Planctomycetota bacterium]